MVKVNEKLWPEVLRIEELLKFALENPTKIRVSIKHIVIYNSDDDILFIENGTEYRLGRVIL